jgi:hypothetical protein
MLRNATAAALRDEGIYSPQGTGQPDYLLALQIIEYRPGNAFKRWLLPGWGSTVLRVHGDLRDARNGAVVASVDHRHSVFIGGVFTIGAWERIFTLVADDIAHDLKIRSERGDDIANGKVFIVSLSPRADQSISVAPPDVPISTKIVAMSDRRSQTWRIGERYAAFGISMGDVYFFRHVPEFLRQSLADELSAMGHRIVDSDEDFTVVGELQKFWIYTDTTPLYWDIISDIQVKLAIQPQKAAFPPVEHEYACKKSDRTYVWPTSTLLGKVLGECMDELMQHIRSDSIWTAGRQK